MQNQNTEIQSKWQHYTITLSEETKMSSPLLEYAINKFKKEISNNLEDNQYYHCQLQCQFHVLDELENTEYYIYRSISYLQFFMKNGQKERTMLNVFWQFWTTFYEERYKLFLVKSISIQYKVVPLQYNNLISSDDVQSNLKPKQLQERINKPIECIEDISIDSTEQLKYKNYSGYNLPLTLDITKWGYTIFNEDYTSAICWGFNINEQTSSDVLTLPVLYDSTIIKSPEYIINIKDLELNTKIRIQGNEIFSFEDRLHSLGKGESNLTNFIRTINKTKYFYNDGIEQFMIKDKKVNYILTKKNKDSFKGTQFITMDLETKSINGVLTPYCVSIFNGKTVSSFYITDFKDSKELLENAIKSLIKKEYNGYKVYLHNFSYFDGIFLLTIITSLSDNVKILIRDSRIIDVKVGFGKNKIFFRDSLLMIPISLAKAAKSFSVEDKGKFPYRFVNQPEITYDYIGPVPSYDFFENKNDDFTEEDYKEYCKDFNNDWDLEKETIKYCEQDCITLYQILKKFSSFIYDEFKINFLNSPTLSSLAFIIYRTNFIPNLSEKENKLPVLTGKIYSDIKKSYTGGAVDVYLPYGENLYLYDINSLYPSVMREFPMPVGQPKYFEGDILKYNLEKNESASSKENENNKNNDRPFGFFEVEITTPDDILNPILQTKLKGRYSRTIAPIGKWIGWYFSEELYNAEKYGYKFKILRGYTFEKEFIFPDYVDFLYNIKCNSEPDSAMYTVSKLLLNSLYGRLGMSPFVENHTVIESTKSDELLLNDDYTITDVVDLQNGKELISYFSKKAVKALKSDEGSTKKNISIAIASAVTAYARIKMSAIKMDKNIKIYYSDTDSFVVDQLLNNNIVSEKLGDFKLENKFIKAAFVAPKVYGGILKDKLDKKGNPKEKVKIKGLKKTIKFEELVGLLKKDFKLKKPQEKFYRDLANSRIVVDNSDYTLIVTGNKRKIIYEQSSSGEVFTKTKPLKILYNDIIDY